MAKEKRFVAENVGAEGASLIQIITDKETGVQYLLAVYPNLGSGLTVLIDKDGKPLLENNS